MVARMVWRLGLVMGLLVLVGCSALGGEQNVGMPTLLPTPTPRVAQPTSAQTQAVAQPTTAAAPTPAGASAPLPTPAQDSGAASDEAWWWFPAEGVTSLRLRFQIVVQSPRHQNGEPWTYMVIEGEAQREPTPLGHWTLYEKGAKIMELYALPGEMYVWGPDQGWIYARSSDLAMTNTVLILGPALDMTYATMAPTAGQDQGVVELHGLRARHYTWAVEHVDQLQTYTLIPYHDDILSSLGYPPGALAKVVAFQADIYLAEDGGWPIKQVLTWDAQVGDAGQAEPLRVQMIYEVYDFNAPLNLQIPADVQGQRAQAPIPMPPGSENVTSIVSDGSSGWIYQVNVPLEELLTFWQDQGVQIQSQWGTLAMGGVAIQATYQGKVYTIAVQASEPGLSVVITPSGE